ncbi:12009_t:CDS:1 [Ambispora leptoticha]|uniref:12009_t:CDS:1 n=1 Tax=Ambispora leptoticha TaxID=144679 RepID=A0A9N9GVU8_9GLOM|nr:12009_t:CDS:1 [Ambispora leptoticha]
MTKKRIGIYGINCAGKTTVLNGLKETFEHVYEGSELVTRNITLEKFKKLDSESKTSLRIEAIKRLREITDDAIVTGHFSFAKVSPSNEVYFEPVMTDADRNYYTDIIYIDISPGDVYCRLQKDAKRRADRPLMTVEQIKQWLDYEKKELVSNCIESGIIFHKFCPLSDKNANLEILIKLIRDIRRQTETNNEINIKEAIKKLTSNLNIKPKVFLLLDADRTLSKNDTGILFWEKYHASTNANVDDFRENFRKHGHTYSAFLQAACKYSSLDDRLYKYLCKKVVEETELHPEFIGFLKSVLASPSSCVVPIVILSGIVNVWQTLLERHFGNKIPLLGGNLSPSGEEYIMDVKSKALCVEILKDLYPDSKIMAFGDSEVDLEMLASADESFLVVDYTNNKALRKRLNEQKYSYLKKKLKKISFPKITNGLYDENDEIPAISLESILFNLIYPANISEYTFSHASSLIATASRRKEICGLELCNIHENIGYFMASKVVEDLKIISVSIDHVQGHSVTNGFALENEVATGIVAMMRAGEHMAKGVWKFMPNVSFIHYKENSDLDKYMGHLERIFVVDFVINEGNTMRDILNYLIRIHRFSGKIIVITGVIQDVTARKLPLEYPEVLFYALRTSMNKYKGVGATDTGHRLYNTTVVD